MVKLTDRNRMLRDYLIQLELGTAPCSPPCQVIGLLYYKGIEVGYRVSIKPGRFDVEKEELELYRLIFGFEVVYSNNPVRIELESKGNQLVAVGYPDVPTASCATLAEVCNKSYMAVADMELQLLYAEFNRLYFNNELPHGVPVYWNSRLVKTGGRAFRLQFKPNPKTGMTGTKKIQEIQIASNRKKMGMDDVKGVLLHEMVHIKHPGEGHGYVFKAELARLNRTYGLNVTRFCESANEAPYVYHCPQCGKEFGYTRKIKTTRYCRACPPTHPIEFKRMRNEDSTAV